MTAVKWSAQSLQWSVDTSRVFWTQEWPRGCGDVRVNVYLLFGKLAAYRASHLDSGHRACGQNKAACVVYSHTLQVCSVWSTYVLLYRPNQDPWSVALLCSSHVFTCWQLPVYEIVENACNKLRYCRASIDRASANFVRVKHSNLVRGSDIEHKIYQCELLRLHNIYRCSSRETPWQFWANVRFDVRLE